MRCPICRLILFISNINQQSCIFTLVPCFDTKINMLMIQFWSNLQTPKLRNQISSTIYHDVLFVSLSFHRLVATKCLSSSLKSFANPPTILDQKIRKLFNFSLPCHRITSHFLKANECITFETVFLRRICWDTVYLGKWCSTDPRIFKLEAAVYKMIIQMSWIWHLMLLRVHVFKKSLFVFLKNQPSITRKNYQVSFTF